MNFARITDMQCEGRRVIVNMNAHSTSMYMHCYVQPIMPHFLYNRVFSHSPHNGIVKWPDVLCIKKKLKKKK